MFDGKTAEENNQVFFFNPQPNINNSMGNFSKNNFMLYILKNKSNK